MITISSRGIVPLNITGNTQSNTEAGQAQQVRGDEGNAQERRGWGLKLIKTLMDEVEFERVDEGTSLRMTKYLRKST